MPSERLKNKPAASNGSDRLFSPLQVLVVDDVPAIRRMLCQMLQALGVRPPIHESGDGLEAWKALQERSMTWLSVTSTCPA